MLPTDFVVHNPDGTVAYALSYKLAEKQKLTDWEMKMLVTTHEAKLGVFAAMQALDPGLNKTELRELAEQVTFLEFKLQSLWRFEQNANYHEWYLVPHCTCPKLDNEDYRGTTMRIKNADCPIHGKV